MIILKGKGVSDGIEIGRILFYKKNDFRIEKLPVKNPEQEILRFHQAKERASQELDGLSDMVTEDVLAEDKDAMDIFGAHQMILQDEAFIEFVEQTIRREQVRAEYAVHCASEHFTKLLHSTKDEYVQARVMDIQDIAFRLIHLLQSDEEELLLPFAEDKVIVVAKDLLPSETVRLDKSRVLGFATQEGSYYSHTAILARTQGVPAIVGLGEELSSEYDGALGILDGEEGILYIHPDAETMECMNEKRHQLEEQRNDANLMKLEESANLEKKIQVFANAGNEQEVLLAEECAASGIGLFRSECFYLERDAFPTEEEQFQLYQRIVKAMQGKPVTIRTLDVGADKQADYFKLKSEPNPALGYRGIRISLDRKDLFKTQLRAIYRASIYGEVRILFPFITSMKEVYEIKQILEEVEAELTRDGLPYEGHLKIGVMIETPASVFLCNEFAKEVDFFSIGTNDLTQYALAADRQNVSVEKYYNPHHPAILAMIEMVADKVCKNGKEVCVCGDLAADLEMTEKFIEMGITALSVPPLQVGKMREKIRTIEEQ